MSTGFTTILPVVTEPPSFTRETETGREGGMQGKEREEKGKEGKGKREKLRERRPRPLRVRRRP